MKKKHTFPYSTQLFTILYLINAYFLFRFFQNNMEGTNFVISIVLGLGISLFATAIVCGVIESVYSRLSSAANTADIIMNKKEGASEAGKDGAAFLLGGAGLIYKIIAVVFCLFLLLLNPLLGFIAAFIAYVIYELLFIRPKRKMNENTQLNTINKMLHEYFKDGSFNADQSIDVEPIQLLNLFPKWNNTEAKNLITETRNESFYEVSSLLARYTYMDWREVGSGEDIRREKVQCFDNLLDGTVIHKVTNNNTVDAPFVILPKDIISRVEIPSEAVALYEQDSNYVVFGIGYLPEIYEVQKQLTILNSLSSLSGASIIGCIFSEGSYYIIDNCRFLEFSSDLSNVEIASQTSADMKVLSELIDLIG